MKRVKITQAPMEEWGVIEGSILGKMVAKITKIRETKNSFEYKIKAFWDKEEDGWYSATDEMFVILDNGDRITLYENNIPLLLEYYNGNFFKIGVYLKPAGDE